MILPTPIPLKRRVEAFLKLGKQLSLLDEEQISEVSRKAQWENAWFTEENVKMALSSLAGMLSEESLNKYILKYPQLQSNYPPKTVGVVMAGNIPAVGFHDAFCVLLSGNILMAKLSKSDTVLMNYILVKLKENEPEFAPFINVTERLAGFEAVICTGSDNTARYFESYFGKYPHIIRKNRTSVAVLTGNETEAEIESLGLDIFSYFGLGCRNVSKVFIPGEYDITKLIDRLENWSYVINQHKYANNYTYNRAIYLLNQDPFLDNNFLLLKETENLHSPISVLFYERYTDAAQLAEKLLMAEEKIQCVVANQFEYKNKIDFGKTQFPLIDDYADGVDTMEFLLQLS